ncbi:MAG: hypothetical protein K2X86_09055 [Cytophagaceae bacterium]|nr:hypothetical protein [Cytophagaceae bacterium]
MKTAITETKENTWPELTLQEWEETYSIVHLWMQVIGKIKLQFAEFTNHWWNITFSLTATGITSGIIPYGSKSFEMEFNFISHELIIKTDDGRTETIKLQSGTVAAFYLEIKEKLQSLGIEINIWTVPVEIDDRLPLDQDHRWRNYNPTHIHHYWKILLQTSKVMKIFRSGFTGKASPVHFFWGSFDIAVTFFSGRPAPEHAGAPNVGKKVMRESYNAELASFGFWGGKGVGEAAFYAYAYPEPDNYKNFAIEPAEANYNETFREFILPYAAIINHKYPEDKILDFYRSAFKAAEELSNWDRSLYKEIQ